MTIGGAGPGWVGRSKSRVAGGCQQSGEMIQTFVNGCQFQVGSTAGSALGHRPVQGMSSRTTYLDAFASGSS